MSRSTTPDFNQFSSDDSGNESHNDQQLSPPVFELNPHVWRDLKEKMELISRAFFMRYPKPTAKRLDNLIFRVHNNGLPMTKSDTYYINALQKMKSNRSTWKHDSLKAMKVNLSTTILIVILTSASRIMFGREVTAGAHFSKPKRTRRHSSATLQATMMLIMLASYSSSSLAITKFHTVNPAERNR